MPQLTFRLPRLGGNESDARILAWKKAPGEAFVVNETLLEVETDKAVVEVSAPADGTLLEQRVAVDAVAAFDDALAEIDVSAEAAAALGAVLREPGAAPAAAGAGAAAAPAPAAAAAAASPASSLDAPPPARAAATSGRVVATPAARAAARAAGIDLARVAGSGPNGRVVLADVRRPGAPPARAAAAVRPVETLVATAAGEVFVRRWQPAAARGPTAVLIHGLFGDADTWAGVASALAEAGRPVLALDLPAHGRTGAGGRTVGELAGVVAQVLRALHPGPVQLVGHSLGGAVAALVAQAAPVPVRDLVLIAPAGLGTEIDPGFVAGMQHADTPALLRRELAKLAQRLPAFGDALVAEMHRGLRARAAPLAEVVAAFAHHGVQQVDIRPTLDALGLPVAVLWGRMDRVLPWTHALALPPQVALHLFADAGHMPQWECGSVVARVIAGRG